MLSPSETWPLMENVRAEKGLKGYLILCPWLIDKGTNQPTTVVADSVVESESLSSQSTKPAGFCTSVG